VRAHQVQPVCGVARKACRILWVPPDSTISLLSRCLLQKASSSRTGRVLGHGVGPRRLAEPEGSSLALPLGRLASSLARMQNRRDKARQCRPTSVSVLQLGSAAPGDSAAIQCEPSGAALLLNISFSCGPPATGSTQVATNADHLRRRRRLTAAHPSQPLFDKQILYLPAVIGIGLLAAVSASPFPFLTYYAARVHPSPSCADAVRAALCMLGADSQGFRQDVRRAAGFLRQTSDNHPLSDAPL
jgi:hypothetical protein